MEGACAEVWPAGVGKDEFYKQAQGHNSVFTNNFDLVASPFDIFGVFLARPPDTDFGLLPFKACPVEVYMHSPAVSDPSE